MVSPIGLCNGDVRKFNASHKTTRFIVGETLLSNKNPIKCSENKTACSSIINVVKKIVQILEASYTLQSRVDRNTVLLILTEDSVVTSCRAEGFSELRGDPYILYWYSIQPCYADDPTSGSLEDT